MKILVLSNLYPPNIVGGYERLCADVASALAAAGHAVAVLTSDYGEVKIFDDTLPVLRELHLLADDTDIYRAFETTPEMRAEIQACNDAALRAAIETVAPDVIFAWNLFFLGDSMMEVLKQASPPTVFFLTDNWLIAADAPDRISEFFHSHVHGGVPFDALKPHEVDRVVPHAAIFGAEFMRRLYTFCGYAFARSQVIHNGVMLPRIKPLCDRRRLVADGELRLLFAGRMVDLKGPQDAVAALPLIQQALPELKVRLTLLGDRRDRAFAATLDAAIAQSGLSDRIRFEPPIGETDLPDLFDRHDVYLFPSRYEPFALTLIHALAAGVPVVASNAGGNSEIVLDGRTGVTFPLGDPMSLAAHVVKLAQAPELRASLAARGQRVAYRFSRARMLRQIETVLAAVASG